MPNLGDLLESLGNGGDGEHSENLLKLLSLLGEGSLGGVDFHKRIELNRLYNEGLDHYRQEEHNLALSCWRSAFQLALELEDKAYQVSLKRWEGHALFQMDSLMEALTCFMESETMEEDSADLNSLTMQIAIAVEIPLPLTRIQALLHRLWTVMEQQGLQNSRSMLLHQEAQLASFRHDFPTAIAKAQEALFSYDVNAFPRNDPIDLYVSMINIYLDTGDIVSAHKYIKLVEGVKTEYEVFKEQRIFTQQMRLAILEEDFSTAMDFAVKSKLSENIIEASIVSGVPEQVYAQMVSRTYRNFHNEDTSTRYPILRQAGDLHRALAKKAEFASRERKRHTAMARRYYGYAMKVGGFIDERLQCNWHVEEIQKRLRSLE